MRINEIFYSLQGEGYFTGTPALFIRFSECNLKCEFCDTRHKDYTRMSVDEIISQLKKLSPDCRHIVLTGGEPTLQLTEPFITRLKREGYFIQIETNGTVLPPPGIDWVTCSPKLSFCKNGALAENLVIDELKLIYRGNESEIDLYKNTPSKHRFLQPCSSGDSQADKIMTARTVKYIKTHPEWRLSLQTHKLIDIP